MAALHHVGTHWATSVSVQACMNKQEREEMEQGDYDMWTREHTAIS